jgi:hypothetical protein
MIPQMHDDKIQGEEQLPSPLEEKQKQTPISLQRWIAVLLCILGIAMPLVAGSIAGLLSGVTLGEIYLYATLLVIPILAAVGAFLLGFVFRAWWAAWLVPVAWIVGDFLGIVVHRLLYGELPFGIEHFWEAHSGFLLLFGSLMIILGFIGVAFGIRFRRWWDMRQRRQ